ncbi:hypothetical protein [Sphingomonas sp. LHG3406-1]|uniref:hypothetical protein n=1 Tax=Sphingomonas sp. LHG3406-1 TaxID=2804617 RepID=UPI002631E253|nr:hypothetical protein [Sphingomonas sp. LHG3406-1]
MSDWYEVKLLVEHATGWPMDTLHVMAGVILQLVFATLLRRSLADLRPWGLVLLFELANEAHDLWVERWPSLGMQLGEGLRDLIGTMLLPTLLLLIARTRPRLLAGRR